VCFKGWSACSLGDARSSRGGEPQRNGSLEDIEKRRRTRNLLKQYYFFLPAASTAAALQKCCLHINNKKESQSKYIRNDAEIHLLFSPTSKGKPREQKHLSVKSSMCVYLCV
jgi:hypothetical protein